ncbi:MAG: glutamate-5-semialdehyde dehydrogenase [Sedimentibacter saalensis]|uniref:glutamate-5-semialdehyde dehydrogenase n=1 Tax=Sedimentibacter saalensis TaxID=130788 RepID=UPI002B1F382A|nr:glutamate-5-semialdehyde dehydrogenase [Sedimentibacter saalensis]MEA5095649.1 glutamate-5-semialdehyde dehydrogenase [Sedimentibacter saalensis]
MSELIAKGKNAKEASYELMNISTQLKNDALKKIAENLVLHSAEIIEKNELDIKNYMDKGMGSQMVDRLMLNEERIASIAEGVRQIAELEDPVGEVMSMKKRPNGLLIGQKRVPLGVIGIIYESRPNVTVDAASLCLKSSNAVMLRGSSDAINSNKELVKIMKMSLAQAGIHEGAIELVEDTSRETASQFMKLNDYLDVLIPRGGAGLIKTTLANATVPVIETGTGNCHVYVDEFADIEMAYSILINAKTSRTSVCNACESLLVHKNIKDKFMAEAIKRLKEKNVQVRGCEETVKICSDVIPATVEDYGTEFLDLIISVKVVESIDEAIKHINKYGTGHSETIVTESYTNSQRFLNQVDAACVYVNASTRFTDGFEFGFGAEIGISTQKMHARGPMGLKELTTSKYIIYGNGQIR